MDFKPWKESWSSPNNSLPESSSLTCEVSCTEELNFMKTAPRILIALFLGAVLQTGDLLQAQVPVSELKPNVAAMPKGGVKTQDDFKKVLASNEWAWTPMHGNQEKLEFQSNGTLLCSAGWTGKWEVKGLKEVTIKRNKGELSKLVFKEDYTSFSGTDLSGKFPIKGNISPSQK